MLDISCYCLISLRNPNDERKGIKSNSLLLAAQLPKLARIAFQVFSYQFVFQ